jgi:hypothetical protein
MPSAGDIDTQIRNEGGGTTTISSSWLIIHATNLGDPPVYASLYENGASCTNQVSGSEVEVKVSEGWKRSRTSSPITLSDGTDYMVCVKVARGTTISMAGAKIIQEQSSPAGISKTEMYHTYINAPSSHDNDIYQSQQYFNEYNPDNFNGANFSYYFDTTIKTPGGTGYTRLYNNTDSEEILNSENTTTSTTYVRVRSEDILTEMPAEEKDLDTQIRNSSTNVTTVSTSNLVIRATFTSYSIIHDSTANLYHGTLTGGKWNEQSSCISGGCLFFNGLEDHIYVNNKPKLNFKATDGFSISLWFKRPQKSGGVDVILAKYEDTGSDGGYKLYMDEEGKIVFGVSDTNTVFPKDYVSSVERYDDNIWHHIIATKDGTNSLSLYINGNLSGINNTVTSGSLVNNDKLYIGIDGDGSSNPWKGLIDEVRVYPYKRSENEVQTDFIRQAGTRGSSASFGARNQTPLYDNLLGHWKMDETESGTCSNGADSCDSSGNSNHGTWLENTSSATGRFGNALSLTGTGSGTMVMGAPTDWYHDWYEPDLWQNRMEITFNNSESTENLTNFPVLVKLDSTRIDYSKTKDNGEDIRFTDSDGTTLLSHEIEQWNESGDSFVWVKVPNIPAQSTNNFIYMYYNNPEASRWAES